MTAPKKKIDSKNTAQASLIDSPAIDFPDNDVLTPSSFEVAYSELQTIVSQMESGQMSLEASLNAYQRGDFLLQFCQKSLAEVEQQVQILNERNQLVPFSGNDE